MKDIIPNLFKGVGVLAVSALVIYLFMPKKRINDEVLNTAMEFLGTKLLAMVPQSDQAQVAGEFEVMREEVLQGKVSEKQLQEFAAVVLDAEAAGLQLAPGIIDSSWTALRQAETKEQVDERKLRRFAERLHDIREFQVRLHGMEPDSLRALRMAEVLRPTYRVSRDLAVIIDSLAFVEQYMPRAPYSYDSVGSRRSRRRPPPPEHHVDQILLNLAKDLKRIKIEIGRHEMHRLMADSLRMSIEQRTQMEHPGLEFVAPPPPPAKKEN